MKEHTQQERTLIHIRKDFKDALRLVAIRDRITGGATELLDKILKEYVAKNKI